MSTGSLYNETDMGTQSKLFACRVLLVIIPVYFLIPCLDFSIFLEVRIGPPGCLTATIEFHAFLGQKPLLFSSMPSLLSPITAKSSYTTIMS